MIIAGTLSAPKPTLWVPLVAFAALLGLIAYLWREKPSWRDVLKGALIGLGALGLLYGLCVAVVSR